MSQDCYCNDTRFYGEKCCPLGLRRPSPSVHMSIFTLAEEGVVAPMVFAWIREACCLVVFGWSKGKAQPVKGRSHGQRLPYSASWVVPNKRLVLQPVLQEAPKVPTFIDHVGCICLIPEEAPVRRSRYDLRAG